MLVAPLLLSTVAEYGKRDSIVVWDPVAGNPVATFTGETVAKGTLSVVNNTVFGAMAKKPILQLWSFQSNSSFKRLTTKGLVSAIAFSHNGLFMYLAIEKSIHIYQTCSGCLITVLEASHMAPISGLAISERQVALRIPLLLSADTSGVIACWPAIPSIGSENMAIDDQSSSNVSSVHLPGSIKPLWYAVQASQTVPSCAFVADGRMVACAGSNGLKLFDTETGEFLRGFLDQSRPLLCICVLPHDDRYIFCGTDNGILHSIWMREPEDFTSYDVSFRRCFSETELSPTDKAICCLSASPIESNLRLLTVCTRSGLIEILRLDAGLVRLQRFSVFQSTPNDNGPHLANVLMVSRPNWLLERQARIPSLDETPQEERSDPLEAFRPIKRHMGWQLDDLLYLKLPNLNQNRMLDVYAKEVYKDEFLLTTPSSIFAVPFGLSSIHMQSNDDPSQLSLLREEKEALKKKNGELMRILVANCLHY